MHMSTLSSATPLHFMLMRVLSLSSKTLNLYKFGYIVQIVVLSVTVSQIYND